MRFSHPWNKLSEQTLKENNGEFTTIRQRLLRRRWGSYLYSDSVGKTIKVAVYDNKMYIYSFKAIVLSVEPIKKADMTDELARKDADTDRAGLINILEGFYHKNFDDYVLIKLRRVDK